MTGERTGTETDPDDFGDWVVPTMRRSRRWGLLLVAVAVVLLSVTVLLIHLDDQRVDDLTRQGERVVGQVTACGCPGSNHIEVGYRWDGHDHIERVNLSSDVTYRLGQRVTVLIDPSDPSNMTVAGEDNSSKRLEGFLLAMMVVGVAALVWGLLALVSVRRKRRALRSQAWEPVTLGRLTRSAHNAWWVAVRTKDGQWRDARVGVVAGTRLWRPGPGAVGDVRMARGTSRWVVLSWGERPALYAV